ncbi:hypothetical protein HanRHA438_Chr11g0529331 [Helianthus annuus]|nr:hypothetical protein HanLR1_Chr11g0426071 [Helianthus annuus]KAJ0872930.1 hypothetical protein HanRHA438_Chr11g0529331 [Helianthus annuus]KAJ0877329.1 hypothetical protein HanPSC8_Chr11g0498851 [Helianthus annuus]
MGWQSPDDAMPWVGLYTAVASLICTIAMALDAIHAVWQWKLWFPNKFFTLNAATITLIAIAMKLPVDLDPSSDYVYSIKIISIFFLVTMLANFLPSLGLMDDKELLMNTVALAILVITVVVNMGIQFYTLAYFYTSIPFIYPILWPFSVALSISTIRKKLEHRYKESQQLVLSHQEKMFSYKELKLYVKTYWMMTETRNPQFVIACSPVSSAFGVICSLFILVFGLHIRPTISDIRYNKFGNSDYKWSLAIILMVQFIGVVVGSIAPVFRCYTYMGYYTLSKKWSKNQLNVFRVEKHWIQRFQNWKRYLVHSHIPGRHCKILSHNIKNTILNLFTVLHISVLVICKTICLIPRAFLILLSFSWCFFESYFKRFKKRANTSNSDVRSEIEEYSSYVVQVEEEAKLSNRVLRNMLHSITRLLNESEQKEPRNLLMLLEKSVGFNGVVEFDNDRVPPLYPEETRYCWSLVVVTLTATAMALPNIENGHIKGLLSSVGEGLQIVKHIEECLNVNGDLVKARKAARRVWRELEVYQTWLQIDLQNKARKGKTSKEILKWLGDKAAKIAIHFKSSKMSSIDHSPCKFILASSMYRISQTILRHCNEKLWNGEELLEWISTTIADILSACFINLPRVIKMKCYHHAIEKRGDYIQNAAKLLGKSKKILKVLKARQLPNIDVDSMAYIDKWRVLTMSPISNGGASSAEIQPNRSSCNESLIVTIM